MGKGAMMKVYIQQVERTRAYKKTDLSLVDLLCEPAQKILSKVDPSRIDGVFISVQNISSFTGEGNIATKVADRLGLRGAEAERVETASNGHTALLRAFDAVASGRCKRVLAVGGEKMSAVPREERSRIIGEVVDPIDRACGLTMPSAIALISLEYARVNGVSPADFQALLEKIAIRAYRYAAANPDAPILRENDHSGRVPRCGAEPSRCDTAARIRFLPHERCGWCDPGHEQRE